MATSTTTWGIHWQTSFASFEGTSYTVNIYDKDYTGDVVSLKCGPEPFVTQEDDDDDYFKNIRSQSGYLRLIDETADGTLMEEIVPENNTQRIVKLLQGDTVKWQGFIQAQAYSQPWDKQTKLIEFPIKSILGALEDVKLVNEDFEPSIRLIEIVKLIETVAGFRPYDYLVAAGDLVVGPTGVLFNTYINTAVFFSQETSTNEGNTNVYVVGVSLSDALQYILALFGLVAREDGSTLYLMQYDHPGTSEVYTKTAWADFADASSLETGGNLTAFSSAALLDTLAFRGADNTIGFTQGASTAKIDFQFSDGSSAYNIEQPASPETSDDLLEVKLTGNDYNKMYVQPHEPASTSLAKYQFFRYTRNSDNGYEYQDVSDYDNVLTHSILKGYRDRDPRVSNGSDLYTGAFPVRFYHQQAENTVVNLSSGLWLNLQYTTRESQILARKPIFTIQAAAPANMVDGFVNIQFGLDTFHHSDRGDNDSYTLNDYNSQSGHLMAYMSVSIDGKYWNPDSKEWSDTYSVFWTHFADGEMESNRTDDMKVDETSGYFVRVAGMKGIIKFEFLDLVYTPFIASGDYSEQPWTMVYAAILHNLKVQYLPTHSAVASSRTSNVYQTVITTNGFTAEKKIDLSIGTINNNQDNQAFIRDSAGEYRTMYAYSSSPYSYERPELHLLTRLAKYYSKSRRVISAVVKDNLDLMTTRYTYNNRVFVGFDASRDWRDDKQEVKFVEVTGDNE